MAVLSDDQRKDVWAELMRAWSNERAAVTINKTDLRAAVDAIDTFFNANITAINNAFPATARAGLTPKQKALVLVYVIAKRFLLEG